MVFSSFQFIVGFLPIFLILYYICPEKLKSLCILSFSLAFYAVGVFQYPLCFLLFTVSIIVNFYIGKCIQKNQSKIWLCIGIVYNLSWLLIFKYGNLFLDNIILPLGISFYTFQSISYLVDVYRTAEAETSFVSYGAYVSMFPQLISGPLVRYKEIKRQRESREISGKQFLNGVEYFIIGMGLKVLLANRIGGVWSNMQTIGYESISTPLAWMGMIAFSLQLYFDFWGYSLMAQGVGKMMGYELPQNFDIPYMSLTMTDFWRRWHMTLGMWFREYVYIPLGGNRGGKARTIFNLFVVWCLTAVWHGASFNFLLWGLLIYVLILIEKNWLKDFFASHKWIAHIYMFFAINFSWLLFAITDMEKLGHYICRLCGIEGIYVFHGDFMKYMESYGIYMLVGLVFATNLPHMIYEKIRKNIVCTVLLLTVICGFSFYCIYMGQNDTFMYFNF